jgi:glycosyltransferase involved in cell wall biosynthesis
MNITLVMASDEDGGLEKHVLELAEGLAQFHQVSLIAHQKYQNQLSEKVNFVAFDMSGSRYNPWTKYQLKKVILATQPDILHAHASKTAKLLQGMLKQFSFPSVVTVHGKKKSNQAYFAFDHVIAVSRSVAEILNQPNKTTVVYNGTKINVPPTPFQKNRKFIAIGRLNSVKGFDLLLQAWKYIPHSLSIVGEGEERSKLEQLIQQYQLSNRVSLLGYRSDIHSLINQHEALIVSSLREGGPYTLAESLLLNRPVLGTDVGMMAEFIPAEFLCKAGNSNTLETLIQDYLQVADPSMDFASAYAMAQEQLTFQKMIEHTLQIYQSLLVS